MISDPDVVGLLYLVAIVCFILALRFLSSPKNARRGNWIGGVGMLVAIGDDARARRDRQLGPDRGGRRDRRGDRARRRADGEDDRDAPDGGPVQRGRGRRGGADRVLRVPCRGRRRLDRRDRLDRALEPDRLRLVRGLDGRVREAPGAPVGAPDRVPRPEHRQLGDPPRRGRPRDRADRRARGAVGPRRR